MVKSVGYLFLFCLLLFIRDFKHIPESREGFNDPHVPITWLQQLQPMAGFVSTLLPSSSPFLYFLVVFFGDISDPQSLEQGD